MDNNYQNYKNELKKLHRVVIKLEENIKTLDVISSLEIMKSEIDNYEWKNETIDCYLEVFDDIYLKLRDKFFWDTMRKMIHFQRQIKNMYKRDIVDVALPLTKEEIKKLKAQKERERKERDERIIKKGEVLDF